MDRRNFREMEDESQEYYEIDSLYHIYENLIDKPNVFINHSMIFDFPFILSRDIHIRCGLSPENNFIPILSILDHSKNEYITIFRREWLHLMTYKDYIHKWIIEDLYDDQFNLVYEIPLRSIRLYFKKGKNGNLLIFRQGRYKIKVDLETWRSLLRVSLFITHILCWNNIIQKQISKFYYKTFVPACVRLNKNNVNFYELSGSHDKDVEIDLIRLCYEFSNRMNKKLHHDIRVYKLNIRMENK